MSQADTCDTSSEQVPQYPTASQWGYSGLGGYLGNAQNRINVQATVSTLATLLAGFAIADLSGYQQSDWPDECAASVFAALLSSSVCAFMYVTMHTVLFVMGGMRMSSLDQGHVDALKFLEGGEPLPEWAKLPIGEFRTKEVDMPGDLRKYKAFRSPEDARYFPLVFNFVNHFGFDGTKCLAFGILCYLIACAVRLYFFAEDTYAVVVFALGSVVITVDVGSKFLRMEPLMR